MTASSLAIRALGFSLLSGAASCKEFPPWLSTSFSPRRATFTDCGVFGKYASNLSYSAFVAAAGSSPHAFVPVGITALLFVIRLETLIREGRREIIIGDSFHFEARMAE